MIPSLRGRLFVGLTAMVALTCAAAGLFAFRYAFDEAIESIESIEAIDDSFGDQS